MSHHPESQKREASLRVGRNHTIKIPGDIHAGISRFQISGRYPTMFDALIGAAALGLTLGDLRDALLEHAISVIKHETKVTNTTGDNGPQAATAYSATVEEITEYVRKKGARSSTGF